MKQLALRIEETDAMSYAVAMSYMRARVSFILARSSAECMRGTHEKKGSELGKMKR